jgi:hypothetical protein
MRPGRGRTRSGRAAASKLTESNSSGGSELNQLARDGKTKRNSKQQLQNKQAQARYRCTRVPRAVLRPVEPQCLARLSCLLCCILVGFGAISLSKRVVLQLWSVCLSVSTGSRSTCRVQELHADGATGMGREGMARVASRSRRAVPLDVSLTRWFPVLCACPRERRKLRFLEMEQAIDALSNQVQETTRVKDENALLQVRRRGRLEDRQTGRVVVRCLGQRQPFHSLGPSILRGGLWVSTGTAKRSTGLLPRKTERPEGSG